VQAFRQAVISQQTALDAKVKGFEAGINTNLEILDAQRDLYVAKRDFAQARYDYLLNTLRLKDAAGMLSPADLGHINSLLEGVSIQQPALADGGDAAVPLALDASGRPDDGDRQQRGRNPQTSEVLLGPEQASPGKISGALAGDGRSLQLADARSDQGNSAVPPRRSPENAELLGPPDSEEMAKDQ
jgi:hypothetical protein